MRIDHRRQDKAYIWVTGSAALNQFVRRTVQTALQGAAINYQRKIGTPTSLHTALLSGKIRSLVQISAVNEHTLCVSCGVCSGQRMKSR